MLRDDSSGSTTSIHPRQIDSNLWEFPSKSTGTPRQRAVLERGDWDLAMGPAEFLLQFSDRDGWWNRYAKEKKVLATRKLPADCMLTLPTMSLPPTRYQTRVQTPRIPEHKIRDSVTYHELEYLGKGSFGRVSRVLDLQWGGIMAVKIINVEREKEKETKETLKREVELLAKLSHPHIIEYKHSQGWEFGEPSAYENNE
ncbi:Pkinase-domain-containing protein [Mollisia scopiformis]|uniref:Pkinase-domain-containing protein n=1 Tax=Mollisia scopiformis TaxID=149040 RepID=A0A132B2F6_MOLSC|nr:Pkinase-domain-containing protein [Mollisia scopiformis]KUJ06219.1 Pkinase-domain-containing protein [Mollisia scopiformis]